MSLRLVHVATEMAPWAKVGGLADVVAALPAELARRGHEVTVFLPGHRVLRTRAERLPLAPVVFPWGDGERRVELLAFRAPEHPARILLVDEPEAFDRAGIYTDPATGAAWPDEADRHAGFVRAVLEILPRMDLRPDVLHVHDHPTALLPVMHRRGLVPDAAPGAATVLTVHNAAYQGLTDPGLLDRSGLGREGFEAGGPLEFWGRLNPLKAGVLAADRVTTVSPRYASEIAAGPEFGCGLEGVYAGLPGGVRGIRNGLDRTVWNPAADPHLPAAYDATDPAGRAACREALAARAGLSGGRTVLGMVSRLVDQKGLDLLRAAGERLLERDVDLVVLGSGEPGHEAFLDGFAAAHPDRVHVSHAFDDPFAHLVYAGCDVFLMPSRYEPCGLSQMIALRYGAVPLARRTGGLADTLRDAGEPDGTAILFDEYSADALLAALDRALTARADVAGWDALRHRGMETELGWDEPVKAYEALYEELRPRSAERRARSARPRT